MKAMLAVVPAVLGRPLAVFGHFSEHDENILVKLLPVLRIQVFLGLPDSDQLVRVMDPDPAPDLLSTAKISVPDPDPSEPPFLTSRIRILLSSCKNNKKKLEPYYFVTLFDFLSLKNKCKCTFKK